MRDEYLRAQAVKAWTHEAHVYFEQIHQCPQEISNPLRRASVIAVALVTLRWTGTDAENFWHQTAMGSGLARGDAQLTLHHFLREKSAKFCPPHAYARYIASAWNAHCAGRTVKQLHAHQSIWDRPMLLEGTPHDGEKVLRYLTPGSEILHDPVLYEPEGIDQPRSRYAI